jgi:hypothetical protein
MKVDNIIPVHDARQIEHTVMSLEVARVDQQNMADTDIAVPGLPAALYFHFKITSNLDTPSFFNPGFSNGSIILFTDSQARVLFFLQSRVVKFA